jgi:NitT/TauT family transport system substrate-binding protein
MRRRAALRPWSLVSLCALLALTLALPAAPWAQARQKVVFTTDFGFNGRHAYYYVALDRGYYREAGLDVEIVRGGGSADAIKQVAAGRATLGFADAGTLVLARGNENVPVKMVAIVYARPPHAIYALEDGPIKSPRDLEGRTLADTAASAIPQLFPVYAKAAGIDREKVRWIVADSASLPALLVAGRVDGIGQFIVGEPLLRKRAAPRKLVRLAYGDAGLDYYGNGLIASETTLRERPDVVRAFVAATVRGMEDAFRDPAGAGTVLNRYHPQIEPDIGEGETIAVRELAVTDFARQRGLGALDEARVAKTIEVVSGAFALKTPVQVADVYAPGFAGK